MYKEFGEFKGKLNANGIRFSILKNNKINLTDKLDLSSFAIDKFLTLCINSLLSSNHIVWLWGGGGTWGGNQISGYHTIIIVYCTQGQFFPVLFSPFFSCKQFSPDKVVFTER